MEEIVERQLAAIPDLYSLRGEVSIYIAHGSYAFVQTGFGNDAAPVYRQKNILGSLENVGYFSSLYRSEN
ncbi:hypothetical protein VN24_17955 [Paenibacillus beijingensis]|uniref:Uncharacterized protein n=1 Tax=Paenibacillus beijingensis TaxID=1126833 RepID=A0A0D5NL72_9BACL|nr:hypothetical protein VN24_17955 [Paenibacillus beijingensis]